MPANSPRIFLFCLNPKIWHSIKVEPFDGLNWESARANELDGKDYLFVNDEEFMTKVKNKEFIEYQNVYNNLYGTSFSSIKSIIDSGKDAILEIDFKGMLSIKKSIPSAISIYILPPSIQELRARLKSRAMDSDEVIENRVSHAAKELSYSKFSDYIIVNDKFADAAKSLKKTILHTKLNNNYERRLTWCGS